jgi:hypothetical protein
MRRLPLTANMPSYSSRIRHQEPRLKTSSLEWLRNRLLKLKMRKRASRVAHAISLNHDERYAEAIQYLRSCNIPLLPRWFEGYTAPKRTEQKRSSPSPNEPQGQPCPKCGDQLQLGALAAHMGKCARPENPVEVREFESLPRKNRGMVKIKSQFKYKLSDESGGNY